MQDNQEGQFHSCLGEIPDLPRVDHHHGQAGVAEGCRWSLLPAPTGLQNDPIGAKSLQPG